MTLHMLGESALRALLLGGLIVGALRLSRVRNPGTEILALQALLAGAWLMPLLMRWSWLPLPEVPGLGAALAWPWGAPISVALDPVAAPQADVLAGLLRDGAAAASGAGGADAPPSPGPLPLLVSVYATVAAVFCLRLVMGLGLAWRVWARSRPLGHSEGVSVRLSEGLDLPVTVGASVLVPAAWGGWDDARRRAILLHEGEHVRQGDFWWQLAAGLYRAIFWFSPLSWWLMARLRDLAERRSDDRVVAQTLDRADYAGLLLELGARPSRLSPGVAMARPGTLTRRIERILDEEETMTRMTWEKRALLLAAVALAVAVCAGGASVARDRAASVLLRPLGGLSLLPFPDASDLEQRYVYVHGESVTMCGDMEDVKRARSYQDKIDGDYIWFVRDSEAFLVSDQLILERFNAIMASESQVSDQQEQLSHWQDRLSDWQDRITDAVERVSAELARRPGSAEWTDSLNLLAVKQAEVGRVQAEVGEEQARLGEQQARDSQVSSDQIKSLLDEAREKGMALPAS